MSLNKWYRYEFYDTFNNMLVLFEDKPEYLEKNLPAESHTQTLSHTYSFIEYTYIPSNEIEKNTFTGDWHRLQKSI